MKIVQLICAPVRTGFFFDDQLAIKNGVEHDGFTYKGLPVTPGFSSLRQAGEAVSVMLLLENGELAWGDCAAVQYSGAAGRDGLFVAEESMLVLNRVVKPWLEGKRLTTFRELAAELDQMKDPETGRLLHTAIRYGVTQALLDAVAKARRKLMVDVIAEEYGVEPLSSPLPIFAQSGDDRFTNADKMIIKGIDVLPHGLFNNVHDKLGRRGEKLLTYVEWLKKRIGELKPRDDYRPVIHVDVYGTIGMAFEHDPEKIISYLEMLEETSAPYRLRVEGPVDMCNREAQIGMMQLLTRLLEQRGSSVELVADEWCNTLEDIKLFAQARAGQMIQIKTPDLGGINNTIDAVLYCKAQGVGAYLGGTCNETDRSAQICVHIAMATGPAQILAKPGMGMDEGYMIIYNEMGRILALRKSASVYGNKNLIKA
ncbi:MAG TPA: methylaspartate ammonia-lyase [Firmicutes bacterium]|nr:methylaspartate ammonia-lyase [Bacillota bacterium]